MFAVISLSFWAEVHYNSIYPEGGINFFYLHTALSFMGIKVVFALFCFHQQFNIHESTKQIKRGVLFGLQCLIFIIHIYLGETRK